MKSRTIRLAAAAAVACGAILTASVSDAGQSHVSSGGAPCIRFEGMSYDPASQYYSATWSNACDIYITVRYSYTTPRGAGGSTRTIPRYGSGSALTFEASSVDSWSEIF